MAAPAHDRSRRLPAIDLPFAGRPVPSVRSVPCDDARPSPLPLLFAGRAALPAAPRAMLASGHTPGRAPREVARIAPPPSSHSARSIAATDAERASVASAWPADAPAPAAPAAEPIVTPRGTPVVGATVEPLDATFYAAHNELVPYTLRALAPEQVPAALTVLGLVMGLAAAYHAAALGPDTPVAVAEAAPDYRTLDREVFGRQQDVFDRDDPEARAALARVLGVCLGAFRRGRTQAAGWGAARDLVRAMDFQSHLLGYSWELLTDLMPAEALAHLHPDFPVPDDDLIVAYGDWLDAARPPVSLATLFLLRLVETVVPTGDEPLSAPRVWPAVERLARYAAEHALTDWWTAGRAAAEDWSGPGATAALGVLGFSVWHLKPTRAPEDEADVVRALQTEVGVLRRDAETAAARRSAEAQAHARALAERAADADQARASLLAAQQEVRTLQTRLAAAQRRAAWLEVEMARQTTPGSATAVAASTLATDTEGAGADGADECEDAFTDVADDPAIPTDALAGVRVLLYSGQEKGNAQAHMQQAFRDFGADVEFIFTKRGLGPRTIAGDALVVIDISFIGHTESQTILERARAAGCRILERRGGTKGLAQAAARFWLGQA